MNCRILLVGTLLGVGAMLTGCAGVATPEPTSVVSESTAPTQPPVSGLAEIADTAWTGTDSDGDPNIFTFNEDASVSTTQMGEITTGINDIWSVDGDVLTYTIDYGADVGIATYIATFDAAAQVLSAEFTTTTGRSGSVDLQRTSY